MLQSGQSLVVRRLRLTVQFILSRKRTAECPWGQEWPLLW